MATNTAATVIATTVTITPRRFFCSTRYGQNKSATLTRYGVARATIGLAKNATAFEKP